MGATEVTMTRTVFRGGRGVDGAATLAAAGGGGAGAGAVGRGGRAPPPGLLDCHTHVVIDRIDFMRELETPFSYWFYVAIENLCARPWPSASRPYVTPPART